MDQFLSKIEAFILRHELLNKAEHYLVALSGGADSVCLLRTMLSLGYHVEAAHCNFHLRRKESDRDEAFCMALCQRLGVKFHVAHFDTLAYSKGKKISIEMAAREQRYTYFQELLDDRQLVGVVVAHHKNDAIETFLLNLTRGTGIDGLKGISPRNGRILRPLLSATKEEILSYLASIGQDYMFDSTNAVDDVQRNFIRLRLMPILKELNPQAEENISRTLSLVGGSLDLLRTAIEEAKNRVLATSEQGINISISALQSLPSAEIILWELLKDKGFTSLQVEQIFDNIHSETGKQWLSPTHSLLINRGSLLVIPIDNEQREEVLVEKEGLYIYSNVEKFTFSSFPITVAFSVSKRKNVASLDADKVTFPLTIRRMRKGDTFIPYGMKGKKSLSKYLRDEKIPLLKKEKTLVITDAKGRIIWVVGLRTDNRFRISTTSKRALLITRVCKKKWS